MTHHILSEKNAKELCPYCGVDLTKEAWDSEFHIEIHYKTLSCKCGKQVSSKALEKRFACPSCNSRIFYKPRKHLTKVKAV